MSHICTVSSLLHYGADNFNIFVSFHCEILGRYKILPNCRVLCLSCPNKTKSLKSHEAVKLKLKLSVD